MESTLITGLEILSLEQVSKQLEHELLDEPLKLRDFEQLYTLERLIAEHYAEAQGERQRVMSFILGLSHHLRYVTPFTPDHASTEMFVGALVGYSWAKKLSHIFYLFDTAEVLRYNGNYSPAALAEVFIEKAKSEENLAYYLGAIFFFRDAGDYKQAQRLWEETMTRSADLGFESQIQERMEALYSTILESFSKKYKNAESAINAAASYLSAGKLVKAWTLLQDAMKSHPTRGQKSRIISTQRSILRGLHQNLPAAKKAFTIESTLYLNSFGPICDSLLNDVEAMRENYHQLSEVALDMLQDTQNCIQLMLHGMKKKYSWRVSKKAYHIAGVICEILYHTAEVNGQAKIGTLTGAAQYYIKAGVLGRAEQLTNEALAKSAHPRDKMLSYESLGSLFISLSQRTKASWSQRAFYALAAMGAFVWSNFFDENPEGISYARKNLRKVLRKS